ncbi:ATP-binding domain-containing protein [bacterium]|nr:ATP-binding domain-containing protein [bacterium]MBU1994109.1 ATP-binding domain-containing protein [bacterium]
MILNKLAKDAKIEKHYETRKKKWYSFFALKDMFVDVKYTYASTIHKVQGSTYETVYIDLTEIENMRDKDMMYRLLYVALTRASKDVKILLPNSTNMLLAKMQDAILNSLDEEFKNLGIGL